MLDINFIRENPEVVKESQKKRGMNSQDVETLLDLDKDWRQLKEETDNLRSRRNKISQEINDARKQGKDINLLLQEAKDLPSKIQEKENISTRLKEKRYSILKNIPNLVNKDVPLGDSSKNKIIEEWGKKRKFKFKPKDHADLLEALDLLDTQTASNVAASRFYYLKGDLVRLNYALICFALDFLRKKNFTLMQPPFMLRKNILEGAIPLNAFEEMIYKIEGEDLYLIGTAEHAINAYYYNKEIPESKLPLRFAGISTCFRKELGSHGKDTKGIFRVHQFEKVEQFIFCKPEDAWKEFELILDNSRQLLKLLEIPFRFVILSSQDMGRVPTKTIDFECYFPSQNAYRELGSCSNCTDYQSRRSNIKYQKGGEIKFVYTLNNTAISTARFMDCFVDNHQQEDGSIKIPKSLWKYTGFKIIKPIGKVNKIKKPKKGRGKNGKKTVK